MTPSRRNSTYSATRAMGDQAGAYSEYMTSSTPYVETDVGQGIAGLIRLFFYLYVGAFAVAFLFAVVILAWKFILVGLVALVVLFVILRRF